MIPKPDPDLRAHLDMMGAWSQSSRTFDGRLALYVLALEAELQRRDRHGLEFDRLTASQKTDQLPYSVTRNSP